MMHDAGSDVGCWVVSTPRTALQIREVEDLI